MSNEIRSVTLERRVLGGLISQPNIYFKHGIFDQLKPEDFAGGHKLLFQIIRDKITNGKTLDTAILTKDIKDLGISIENKNESDILTYLENISFKKPAEETLIEAACELKTVSIRREIKDTALKIVKEMEDAGKLKPDEVITLADKIYNDKISAYDIDEKPRDLFEGLVEEIENNAAQPIEEIGIPTPYPEFNKRYGGFRAGGLYVWVSPAKQGKSSLLADICIKTCIANPGMKALILDTEMSFREQRARSASNLSGINTWHLESGKFANNQAYTEMWKKNKDKIRAHEGMIYHMGAASKDISELESIISRWFHQECGRDGSKALICLDYIKEITGENTSEEEWKFIGKKVNRLKELAGRLGVPIISACQMNALGYGDEPNDSVLAISQAKRLAWFVSYAGIFRKKTEKELAKDGVQWGSHKMVELVARHLGRDGNSFDLVKTVRKDAKNKDVVKWEKNYLNFNIDNFKVEERGSLLDIINSQSNLPINLNNKEKEDDLPL